MKLARWIIRRRRPVIALFAILTACCAVMALSVRVNYNLVDYLPKEAPSTIAYEVMTEEFDTPLTNLRVLVPNVSIPEALDYKARLAEIDGVSGLIWLDDVADIYLPLETLDAETRESYYLNGSAMFTMAAREGDELRIVREIRALIGEDGAVGGDAVYSATSQELAVKETVKAVLCFLPFILIILLVSTDSWLEPLLFLITIGVAVVINMGTNLLLGDVSYMTSSISPILQMAVSLDYAIFLLHSFSKFRDGTVSDEEAMAKAMKRSFPAVMASAMTTLLGFLVLALMRFRIGSDLGINLAKGILLSLLSAMTFLPALAIASRKLLDKTRHRSLMPSFGKFGAVVRKLRPLMIVLMVLMIAPAFLAQNANSFIYSNGDLDPTTRAGQDEAIITEEFGEATPIVLLVPSGEASREAELCAELDGIDGITGVMAYATAVGVEIPPEYLDEAITEQFYSENYARIVLYAATASEGERAFRVVEEVRAAAKRYYGDAALSLGPSVNLYDMRDTVTQDNSVVNLLAVIAIGLVLLLTFRSALLPVLLVLTIELAIWINLAVPYFTNDPICYIGYLVINTVQLGATVDYAILYTDHYILHRRTLLPREALSAATADTTGSILVSGSVLAAAGFMVGLISTNKVVSDLGHMLGRGTLLSMLLVLFALPALLTAFDGAIRVTTVKSGFLKRSKNHEKSV